jgi:uncharacterized MAPEG superfamily protein
MSTLVGNPAFCVYSVSALVLCLNMLVLWGLSGGVRAKTKTTPNKEDMGTVSKGAALAENAPEPVARVLRAHANATANIIPFLFIALLYVAWGGSPQSTTIFCAIFVVARVLHSIVYIAGLQPWRTVFFTIGGLDTLVLIGFVAKQIAATPH